MHDDLKRSKKRSWPNYRNTPDIYLKRIRETEVAVIKVAVPSKILNPHLPNTRHKCHRLRQFARSTYVLTPMPSSYHLPSPPSCILPTRYLFLALKSRRHLNTGRRHLIFFNQNECHRILLRDLLILNAWGRGVWYEIIMQKGPNSDSHSTLRKGTITLTLRQARSQGIKYYITQVKHN